MIKQLATFVALPLFFMACGPVEKNDPPELKDGTLGLVSPFDTLLVDFTTRIPAIDTAQIESALPVIFKSVGEGSSWKVYGDSSFWGFSRLIPDTSYSIQISDLSDGSETQSKVQKITFETMSILDKDFSLDSNDAYMDNNQGSRAEKLADSVKFFNQTPVSNGISIAGMITGDIYQTVLEDNADWFTVWLYATDSVYIELSGFSDDLDLGFVGPVNPVDKSSYDWGALDVQEANGTKSLGLPIDWDAQGHGVNDVGSAMGRPLQYWIAVKTGATFKSKSAYVLHVKVIKKVP